MVNKEQDKMFGTNRLSFFVTFLFSIINFDSNDLLLQINVTLEHFSSVKLTQISFVISSHLGTSVILYSDS
jgi:hypothetical protein